MKPQDLIFFVIMAILIWKRKPEWFFIAGIVSLILSVPLFSFWIFFTAQRLIYFGFAFLLIGTMFYIVLLNKNK